jgi:myb proto-oncogene protein
MARSCSSKDDDDGLNCGSWSAREDKILSEYIKTHGVIGWRSLPKKAGELHLYICVWGDSG